MPTVIGANKEEFDRKEMEKKGLIKSEDEHKKELEEIIKRHEEKGLKIAAHSGRQGIELSRIEVPKEHRGKGIGSDFMRELNSHADKYGKTVSLTPSTDFGGSSIARLTKFYKSHGYVENKGKNKDYSISNSMYRNPHEEQQ